MPFGEDDFDLVQSDIGLNLAASPSPPPVPDVNDHEDGVAGSFGSTVVALDSVEDDANILGDDRAMSANAPVAKMSADATPGPSGAKKRGATSSATPSRSIAAKTPRTAKTDVVPASTGRKRKAAEVNGHDEKDAPAKRGRPSRAAAVAGSARLAAKEASKPVRGRPAAASKSGKPGRPKKSDASNGEAPADEFEVESILEDGIDQDSKQHLFKVKWKGYPESEATWEPKGNLSHAQDLLKAFAAQKKKEKSAATKKSAVTKKAAAPKPAAKKASTAKKVAPAKKAPAAKTTPRKAPGRRGRPARKARA